MVVSDRGNDVFSGSRDTDHSEGDSVTGRVMGASGNGRTFFSHRNTIPG